MALYVMCATDSYNTTKFAWKLFQTADCGKICHILTKLTLFGCFCTHTGPICNVAVTVALYVMCTTDTSNTTKFAWKLFWTAYCGKICHILTKLTLFACFCTHVALYVTWLWQWPYMWRAQPIPIIPQNLHGNFSRLQIVVKYVISWPNWHCLLVFVLIWPFM